MTYSDQAIDYLRYADAAVGRDAGSGAAIMAATGQAYATLALVEEARTANLMTWYMILDNTDRVDEAEEVSAQIQQRMGLT